MKIHEVGLGLDHTDWVWMRSAMSYVNTAASYGHEWADATGFYVERPDGNWLDHTIVDSETAGTALVIEDSRAGVLLTLTAPTLEERLSLAEAALRVLGAIT